MKRRLPLALLAVFACEPNAESPFEPDLEELARGVQSSIVDGTDIGGNPGFKMAFEAES